MQEAACGGNEVVCWRRLVARAHDATQQIDVWVFPPSSRCELRRVIRLWSMPGGARLAIDRAGNENPD